MGNWDSLFNYFRPEFLWVSVVSHKNVTEGVWYILVQLRSLQVPGDWLLAVVLSSLVTGCLSLGRPAARSQQPVARSLK